MNAYLRRIKAKEIQCNDLKTKIDILDESYNQNYSVVQSHNTLDIEIDVQNEIIRKLSETPKKYIKQRLTLAAYSTLMALLMILAYIGGAFSLPMTLFGVGVAGIFIPVAFPKMEPKWITKNYYQHMKEKLQFEKNKLVMQKKQRVNKTFECRIAECKLDELANSIRYFRNMLFTEEKELGEMRKQFDLIVEEAEAELEALKDHLLDQKFINSHGEETYKLEKRLNENEIYE